MEDRRRLDFAKELAASGWYHSMNFPDGEVIEGYMSLAVQEQRYRDFRLPGDLSGRRTLDIGAWDGWFSFEMERHGAAVTAVDLVEVKNFLYAHRRLQSSVTYLVSDVYELPEQNLAPFDFVLFLGVLYHLKHPLLALETVCALTNEMAVVDSFVIDGDEREHIATPVPFMEFYETDELGGNIDNWFGPTVECLMALCRAAGFCRVEYVNTWHRHARVLCYRHWEPEPSGASEPAPVLKDALNTRDYGINLRTRREEYLTLWFQLPRDESKITRFDLRPEVGGFGVQALSLTPDADHWMVNIQLPPGLTAGRHAVRLRTKNSRFSEPRQIYVDTPPVADGLEVRGLCDALTWRNGVCISSNGRYATVYAGGTAGNTDRANLQIYIDEQRVQPTFIGEPDENLSRQINFQCPADLLPGRHEVVIRQAGVSSASFAFDLVP